MLGAFPQFAAQKFRFFCTGGPSLSGVYQRSSFNAAGDIVSPLCTANRMPGGWDPTTPIRFDTALLDKTFCAELNAYAARLAERGVTVWYHFPPMNAAAVEPGQDVDAYAAALQDALTLSLAGDPHTCILASGWFYDTNFHLNASGKTVFTRQLVRDLKAMLGDSSPTGIPLPEMPQGEETAAESSGTANADAGCFVFERTEVGLCLTGLTPEGKTKSTLTVPSQIDGQAVTALSAGVFDGSGARSITLPGSVTALPDGLFAGCTGLRTVVLEQPDPACLAVGQELLPSAGPGGQLRCILSELFVVRLCTGAAARRVSHSGLPLLSALLRYCRGLCPVALANRVEKLLASPKPTSRAMALMLWSVSTSSSFAWVMRKLIR